jgi:3',5'-cyclic AMP phosphodiesterase CpdA
MTEPVASTLPWMTVLGNHETYSGSSFMGLSGVPSPVEIAYYQQRFAQPEDRLAYSFDWAGVHIVALDTFSEREIPAGEAAWLAADLADSDASWKVVFLHEPPWSSNAAHGSSIRVQEAFGRIFAEHNVTLVLSGHDHSYERTHPIDGVTYIVSGGGGEGLYKEWEDEPGWSAYRDAKYHVTVLDIYPDRIEGRTEGTSGDSLADSFTLFANGTTTSTAHAPPTASVPALAPSVVVAILVVLGLLRKR